MSSTFYDSVFLLAIIVFFPSVWKMKTEIIEETGSWASYFERAWVTCFLGSIVVRSVGRLLGYDIVDSEAYTFAYLFFGVGTMQSMLFRVIRNRRKKKG